MPKKSKRQANKGKAKTPQVTVVQNAQKSTDFNPDYSFVINDLRTIGILAGTFVTALVILSFILN